MSYSDPKPCHFIRDDKELGCGQTVIYDTEAKGFREHPSGIFHSRERCKKYRESHTQALPAVAAQTQTQDTQTQTRINGNTNGVDYEKIKQEKADAIKEAQEIRKKENQLLIATMHKLTAALVYQIASTQNRTLMEIEKEVLDLSARMRIESNE